jgi:hypothetical protein
VATPASKEEKLKVPGPLVERRKFAAARRDEGRERDAVRYQAAEELRDGVRFRIPPEQGYLVVPPGSIDAAGAVVSAGNEVVDEIGHEALRGRARKGGFMAQKLLPASATDLDSPYMRFALGEDVVGPIADYLGLVPVLSEIDIWYSIHGPKSLRSSQLWHLDHADITQVKVWLHLGDIGPSSGPLTALDASSSDALADRIDYDLDTGYRVDDARVDEFVEGTKPVQFEGPTGTVDFIDTSRCFHFGSRLEPDAPPRRIFYAHYLTPYAFKFRDYREQAPLRHLAPQAPTELAALVLGGS